MSSDGFYQMSFATDRFGQHGIRVLKAFAPPAIHAGLQAQLPNLVRIHDTGQMPWAGITGAYHWFLGVWSRPTMRIVLYAGRSDRQPLTIAEGVRIEREAIARAGAGWGQAVRIEPADFKVDSKLRLVIDQNTNGGRHWSHGLCDWIV